MAWFIHEKMEFDSYTKKWNYVLTRKSGIMFVYEKTEFGLLHEKQNLVRTHKSGIHPKLKLFEPCSNCLLTLYKSYFADYKAKSMLKRFKAGSPLKTSSKEES
jgi:hypothetical protein